MFAFSLISKHGCHEFLMRKELTSNKRNFNIFNYKEHKIYNLILKKHLPFNLCQITAGRNFKRISC